MAGDQPYEVRDCSYAGYLADGSTGSRTAGVLVLHEAFGLGTHAKTRADMLAELGYVAFAPDLFGETATTLKSALELVTQFTDDWSELRTRCNAALSKLAGHRNVDPARTAAIGFCFGGQAALELGRSGADLRAIVGFHSGLRTHRPEDSAKIKAKILLCLGNQDPFIPAEDRDNFMRTMEASRVDCQLLLFGGVGHSFTNPEADGVSIPGAWYDTCSDQRSWAAMKRLLREAFADQQVCPERG